MKTISDEDYHKFLAEQEKDRLERLRLVAKQKEYKKKIEENNFFINIIWEEDVNNIDLGNFFNPISSEIRKKFPSGFFLIELNLDWVVSKTLSNPDEIFPKDDLWVERNPTNITRLLETIESGTRIIPPMIRPVDFDLISIMDGHHRIAVARFLKLESIPFFVENEYKEKLHSLMKQ